MSRVEPHKHVRAIARFLEGDQAVPRARAMLARTGSIRGLLQATARGVIRPPELTRRERARLRAAVELVALALRPPSSGQFTTPERVVAACPELWLRGHEEVWVVAVDAQLRQIVRLRVSIGSAHRTYLPIKEIVRSLVAAAAAGVFVLHNHPGGGLTPSEEDISFTQELESLCQLVDIALHDHLIVAGQCWVSCVTRQRGTWFHNHLKEEARPGHWWPETQELGT